MWIRSGWHTEVVLVRCVRFCRTLLPSPASMASLPATAQGGEAVMRFECRFRAVMRPALREAPTFLRGDSQRRVLTSLAASSTRDVESIVRADCFRGRC